MESVTAHVSPELVVVHLYVSAKNKEFLFPLNDCTVMEAIQILRNLLGSENVGEFAQLVDGNGTVLRDDRLLSTVPLDIYFDRDEQSLWEAQIPWIMKVCHNLFWKPWEPKNAARSGYIGWNRYTKVLPYPTSTVVVF